MFLLETLSQNIHLFEEGYCLTEQKFFIFETSSKHIYLYEAGYVRASFFLGCGFLVEDFSRKREGCFDGTKLVPT
jgi:hypothetical protein